MAMGQTRPVACRQPKCKGTQLLLGNVRVKGKEVAVIYGCTSCKHREEVPQS